MRVSVEIPEPKASGLDAAIAKQFAEIQRQLMGLMKDQTKDTASMHDMMLSCMKDQQTSLLDAMEKMVGMVQDSMTSGHPSDGMAEALRGLRATVASLPGDLKAALDKQYQQAVKVSVKPQVTVSMPSGLVNRLDSLEASLLEGMKRSRNRTFGSNY